MKSLTWAGLAMLNMFMGSSVLAGEITTVTPPPDDTATERRIDELLQKMTLEEKAGQVNQSGFGPYEKYLLSPTGLGHMVSQLGGGTTAEQAATNHNALQKKAVEQTRLGIPLLIGADGIYDCRAADGTTFPQEINLGSTFDPELIQQVYAAIGREMRAIGYGRTYAPNVGVVRDPRFGRTGECFGEDPCLVSHMAAAAVCGLQGDSLQNGVMATLKHFAAYDESVGGKDSSGIDISERRLREVFLPPFRAGVQAGAGSIMCAYHAVNGLPCAANHWLLTEVLKQEWGFDGFVVTDFMCVDSLASAQHVAASREEAIKMAIEAGVDVRDHDMGDDYANVLASLVRKGYISESTLNAACRRTLRAKFRLGLFEHPYVDVAKVREVVGCPAHKAVALEAARRSLVLLKNSGGLLPLKKDIGSIAVIGPNADSLHDQLGVWVRDIPTSQAGTLTTILQSIKARVAPGTVVRYAKGCEVVDGYEPAAFTITTTDTEGRRQPGFKGEFFENKDLAGEPKLTRIDLKIDYDWGNNSPDPKVPADNFSARWSGELTVPADGAYRFNASVDDGVRLYLDSELLFDAWADHVGASQATRQLQAGRPYMVRLEYHESTGGAICKFNLEQLAHAEASIAEAVEAARQSAVAVVVVGDAPELNAETHDRADLALTGHQQQLVEAVFATGKPTVVVLVNARPLLINWIDEHIPAILEAWNPGEQGGAAVAEALFGDLNPGGKLPVSWPRTMGQLPVYYNQEPGWHGGAYACGTPSDPLYPFGYGLSYTTFEYGAPRLAVEKIGPDRPVEVSVDVRNTGARRGDEVVQLYIHDTAASLVRPAKELRHFRRVTLEPGETKTVNFTLTPDDLAFYNRQMKWVVESGTFEVMVGGSSTSVKSIILTVQ